MSKLSLLSLALLLLARPVAAQDSQAELAASGRDFALKVCGNCHVVEKGQTAPILKPPAPSFASIVKRRGVNEPWLRQFLSSHLENLGRAEKMPNPQLADFEIDKIVAYILQMKRQR